MSNRFLILLVISARTSAEALVIQDLPASALSAAQGSASAALLEGRGDPFQNPAALAFRGLSPNSVSTSFIPMSLGRYGHSLAYARTLKRSTSVGIQARLISAGGIEARDGGGTLTGELRYLEWEAGGGAALRSRYHAAAGLLLQGTGQNLAGSSVSGLHATAGLLIRPFLSYPLHVGATARVELIGRAWNGGAVEVMSPAGNWALGYELLPSFWVGAGGGLASSPIPLGGAVSWTQEQAGVSLRAAASAEQIALGSGYHRKGKFRVDYTFLLGLEGPAGGHRVTTEFEF